MRLPADLALAHTDRAGADRRIAPEEQGGRPRGSVDVQVRGCVEVGEIPASVVKPTVIAGQVLAPGPLMVGVGLTSRAAVRQLLSADSVTPPKSQAMGKRERTMENLDAVRTALPGRIVSEHLYTNPATITVT